MRASVVVPTRDRAARLHRLLDRLERQTLPRAAFEIVVVDDGSRDETADVLAAEAARAAGPLRVVREPVARGPAAARNAGWRAAAAEVIAFTDDDCRPEPGWLEAGLAAIACGAGLVMGRTISDASPEELATPFSRAVVLTEENPSYPTCNAFYPRAVLEAVGGFDESFRLPFGEDMELAWRVKKAGHASAFAADAVVVHDYEPADYARFLRDRRRATELVHVLKLHPELRRLYTLGLFARRSHVHVAATAALAAAAAAIAPGLLAAVPLLWIDRFRPLRATHRLDGASVARWIVADLWEFLLFARASVRYRTVLL